MISIHETTLIDAPEDVVDDVLVNVARYADLWGKVETAADEFWPQVGSSLVVSMTSEGVRLHSKMTVIEREPGHLCRQSLGETPFGTLTWQIERLDKAVKLTLAIELTVPKMLDSPELRHMLTCSFGDSLKDLLLRTRLLAEALHRDV